VIKFEAKNLVGVSKKLEGLEDRMKNPAVAFKRIAIEGWKDVLDHFNKEEDPDGKKWAKLKRKRRRGKTSKGKILQDTGRLRASIRHKVVKDEAVVFTVVDYAKTHQEGIRVPKRSFMGLSKKAVEKIMELFKRYVIELK